NDRHRLIELLLLDKNVGPAQLDTEHRGAHGVSDLRIARAVEDIEQRVRFGAIADATEHCKEMNGVVEPSRKKCTTSFQSLDAGVELTVFFDDVAGSDVAVSAAGIASQLHRFLRQRPSPAEWGHILGRRLLRLGQRTELLAQE